MQDPREAAPCGHRCLPTPRRPRSSAQQQTQPSSYRAFLGSGSTGREHHPRVLTSMIEECDRPAVVTLLAGLTNLAPLSTPKVPSQRPGKFRVLIFSHLSLEENSLPPLQHLPTALTGTCEHAPTEMDGGPDVIRKEVWPFYRIISGVRLCWELAEPNGPKGEARGPAADAEPRLPPKLSSDGSNDIPGRTRPGLAGLRPPSQRIRGQWATKRPRRAPLARFLSLALSLSLFLSRIAVLSPSQVGATTHVFPPA